MKPLELKKVPLTMTRIHNLPQAFAIVRTSGYREPSFQILMARSNARSYHPFDDHGTEGYTIVEDWTPNHGQSQPYRLEQTPGYESDRNIYKVRYRHPQTNELHEVNYWFLPFMLDVLGRSIPLLEFQYRSWLPHSPRRIDVDMPMSMSSFMSIFERIQRDRLEDIRVREDGSARQDYNYFSQMPHIYSEDDHDDRSNLNERLIGARRTRRQYSRPSTPPSQPEVRIVQVEVPVERVVVQTRSTPLPKAVGDILLSNARKSTETCPILATAFSECDLLSITSCFHIFDAPSLTRWCEDHTSCPVCRTKIENVITETRENAV